MHVTLGRYLAVVFTLSHVSSAFLFQKSHPVTISFSDLRVDQRAASLDVAEDAIMKKELRGGVFEGREDQVPPPRPGSEENSLFVCDESVKFWREFQRDGFEPAEKNIQSMAEAAAAFAQKGPTGLSYWIRHAGRSGYFISNALLGNLGFNLHERLVKGDTEQTVSVLPINLQGPAATRVLLESFLCYQQDYKEIETGTYREPWDMTFRHRQSNPINLLTQTSRFVEEAIGTLGRRKRARKEDKDIWISNDAAPDFYPDYYRTAFHYQTDGWMSRKSADVYETSTETLFLGRQDAMQRISLKPLILLSKKTQAQGRPMRVLEVACGTGRFMTFVRDNLPLDTQYTAVDLSPYYLDVARENDKYWRRTRKAAEAGSPDISPARIIQALAEKLPFKAESFDAVVCVYLFHELPREVRAKAASEMSRVLAPGGTVVLMDSIQRGDYPALDDAMGNVDFNEPYYADYTQDFLPTHFQNAGLVPQRKTVRSTTKSLSFTKSA